MTSTTVVLSRATPCCEAMRQGADIVGGRREDAQRGFQDCVPERLAKCRLKYLYAGWRNAV